MPYVINKSNGDTLVTVEDGTADLNTTSLALVGRNFSGYGEYLNENFVKLLENFSRTTPPSSPLTGQLWYDTQNKLLKVFNGTEFVSSGGGIELDKLSTAPHYMTFVEYETGLPPTKSAKEKGLVFQPSSGNFAINKSTAGTSRLEINNGINASRGLNAVVAETAFHIHSDDGQGVKILMDVYGGGNTTTPGIIFRRGPLFGGTGTSAATQLGRILGSVSARGHTGAGYNTSDRASINFVAAESWSGARNGTKIEFYTTPQGSIIADLSAVVHHNGDFEAKGDIIGFSLSDERLKTNIARIESALDKIDQLDGVFFNWNDLAGNMGKDTEKRETGLLAGQVNKVMPEVVHQRDNGMLAVNYEKLFGLVVEAVKELRSEVKSITMRMA